MFTVHDNRICRHVTSKLFRKKCWNNTAVTSSNNLRQLPRGEPGLPDVCTIGGIVHIGCNDDNAIIDIIHYISA